ncbi:MAG: isoprenyl transferase [Bacteroidota bacterium]
MKKVLSESDKDKIDKIKLLGNIPKHIAIIMDGNGRWAKNKGLPRVAGHRKGIETVREIVEACAHFGVQYLTLYTFSTENWKRPKTEVSTLMRLIVKSLKDETNELNKNNIKLTSIGNIDQLPSKVREELEYSFDKTSNNTKMTLNLALSYSGRWELTNAVKKISSDIKDGIIDVKEIDEDLIAKNLETNKMPDPELVIRSGGEMRISNFLLWQIAYSEIYITEVLWPEFCTKDLIDAINEFQTRERRFGLVSEQIENRKN